MAWVVPRTWVAGETLTAALLNEQVRDNWNAAFPVGSLHWRMQAATAVETTIDGFALEGNGVAVVRATYAALNTKMSGLGYPFGSGNGSTTANIPDLSGRTAYAMASSGHTDVNALGDSDGLPKASRSPIHNSTDDLAVASGGAHNHDYQGASTAQSGASGAAVHIVSNQPTNATSTDGSHTHTLNGSVGPGGTRPNDMVPFLVPGVLAVKY